MDTEVPLALLQGDALHVPPLSMALTVIGLIGCIAGGYMAHAAAAGRIGRTQVRVEVARAVLAMLTTMVLSGIILALGLDGLVRTLFKEANPDVDGPGMFSYLLVAGNAVWPVLVFPAIGIVTQVFSKARSDQPGMAVRLGQSLADLATWWLPARREDANGRNGHADEPEFEITMASGEEVEAEEREYIGNILEMGGTTAHEVMTPRPDVDALDVAWEPARIVEAVSDSRFSRFPVYEETIDNVIGIVHLRDILEFLARGEGVEKLDINGMLMEVLFVPSTLKADDVMRDLQKRKSHMAVVIDEYGGTAGILTIEDLLEEIVGEIQDEYDEESKLIHDVGDGTWVIDAQMPLDDLNVLLETDWEAEDVETLGGFITDRMGRIPEEKEELTADGIVLTILSVDKNRIGRVHVSHAVPLT